MLDVMQEPKNVIRTNEKVESIVIEFYMPFSTQASDQSQIITPKKRKS